MGGGGGYREDTYAKDIQGDVGRDEYADFVKRFAPLEEKLGRELSDPAIREAKMKERLAKASDTTNRQFNVAEGELSRELERYGTPVGSDAAVAMRRKLSVGRDLAEVDALNKTRTGSLDMEDEASRAMIATGRGVSANVGGTASSAAGIEANENASAQSLAQARKARRNQAVGTVASLGMMFALSSKKYKKNIKAPNEAAAVRELRKTDIKEFDYKPAVGNPGKKLGPIAEDTPKMFRGPGGKTVDVQNMVGALALTAKSLDKRLKKLEKRNG